MELFSAQAIAAFALAVAPGAIVLEAVEYRRPRLRERTATRSLARYLLFAAGAWIVALTVGGAREDLARVVEAQGSSGSIVVGAYGDLGLAVILSAVGLGLALRALLAVAVRVSYRLAEPARAGMTGAGHGLANLAAVGLSAFYEWDRLLARLRRDRRAQLVHVRLQDGSSVYGVFAAAGGADCEADGRGLLLDAELVERDGRLIEVAGSSGLYVAPAAMATVSFVALPEPSQPGLESRSDE